MRKIEVIPRWRDVVSLRRLLIIVALGVLGIGVTAWATKPAELPPDIIIIRPLPAEDNPYQKEYDEMLKPAVMITTITGRGTGVIIPGSLVHQFNSSLGVVPSGSIGTNEQLNESTVELYILTAAHVVGNYAEVTVTIYTPLTPLFRGESLSASVVITDTGKDLALLHTPSAPPWRGIHPSQEGNKSPLKRGDLRGVCYATLAPRDYTPYLFAPVWVVGCSLGLAPRPSFGHLTAITSPLNSPLTKGDLGGCWEISAPILPGNSGGPVYDANTHELIGIAVWVRLYGDQLITTMAGIVPINVIYEFLDSYRKDAKTSSNS